MGDGAGDSPGTYRGTRGPVPGDEVRYNDGNGSSSGVLARLERGSHQVPTMVVLTDGYVVPWHRVLWIKKKEQPRGEQA